MSKPTVTRVQRRMVHQIVEALNDNPGVVWAYAQIMLDMVQFRIIAVDGVSVYRPVPGKTIEEHCIEDGARTVAEILIFAMDDKRKSLPPQWATVFARLGELPGIYNIHAHLDESDRLVVCLVTDYGAPVQMAFRRSITPVDLYVRVFEALKNEIPAAMTFGNSVH